MKILIVEDDYTSGILLEKYLTGYGECDTVLDGESGVEAFRKALDAGESYDLICLDIMLPKIDGQEVLRQIRSLEEQRDITGRHAVKIIMTTALGDSQNIMKAFREQCEGYLTKPIKKKKLLTEMTKLGLIEEDLAT